MSLESELGSDSKAAGGNLDSGAIEDEELPPLKVAKSLSLPLSKQPHQGIRLSPAETSIQLIKSLMTLLDNEGNDVRPGLHHMPQVWSLVLKSFTTVSV